MNSKLAKIYKCTGADIFLSLQTTKCLAKAKEIRGGENKWQQTHAVEVERSILR